MKLLLISSSPHKTKSKTFLLAKQLLGGIADKTVKTEVIHLSDYKIKFCLHCQKCHQKGMFCPIKDDVGLIMKKMLNADGIILASPNYINQITASMKALFERISSLLHCKRLLGKYIAGVVSSGSGRDQEVLDYIKNYAYVCGAQYSGGVSSCALAIDGAALEAQKLGLKLVADIKQKEEYLEQIKIIEQGREYFKKVILARKDDWKADYAYWLKKGWI